MNINDVYREICDNPHDDEPRLRFAQLVEGSDPAWARFIRTQIEEERQRRAHESFVSNTAPRHPARWAASLIPLIPAGNANRVEFSRGFPALVRMHPSIFAEYGEQLFRLAPIRHIDFDHPYDEDLQDEVDENGEKVVFPLDLVLGCPALDKLESVTFQNLRLPKGWAQQMVACPYFTNLLYLSFHDTRHQQRDIVALAESPMLRKVLNIRTPFVHDSVLLHENLGLIPTRSEGLGGPEWTTYEYGVCTRGVEEKYGYVPWLHNFYPGRFHAWWMVEDGHLPKFPPGSLPPKEEWYELPEPIYHPRTW